MFKKILLPVDLAEPEGYRIAVEGAQELAKAHGAAVRVVTVVASIPTYVVTNMPKEVLAKGVEDAQAEIDKIAGTFSGQDIVASAVVRHGTVYHEVLRDAEDWGADLIVMASHQPQMSTYLLGSNAARIVRHAHCSVLVLRGG